MTDRAERRREARLAEHAAAEERRLADWLTKMPPLERTDLEQPVNIYACDTCGRPTVTKDIHKGTTPMILGCRAAVDLYDADGNQLDSPYVLNPADAERLLYMSDDELVTAGLLPENIDGHLFVALAHQDQERSDAVQDRITEAATDEQRIAFAVAVLEAGVESQIHCPGGGHSVFYNLPPEEAAPALIVDLLVDPPWEWYRPDDIEQIRGLENDMLSHLQAGGLLLRKRLGATGTAPAPNDIVESIELAEQSRWTRFWKGLRGPVAE